jgi:hypothetical protein
MDLPVLPGPSLAELARTTVARAGAAAVAPDARAEGPAGVAGVRAAPDGHLMLVFPGRSRVASMVAGGGQVSTSVPAAPPFTGLELAGVASCPARRPDGRLACRVTVRSVAFTGPAGGPVPLRRYLAAEPDPLWRQAPGILAHLAHGHAAPLLACARAHGLPGAQCVLPRGLDRYGLELVAVTSDGAASVRLSFPGGPVQSFAGIPSSLRTLLVCRCLALPGTRVQGRP